MTRPVILFKSPPTDSNKDPYVLALNGAGYKTYFIEVLQTNSVNQGALSSIISAGPRPANYDGVVFTSSRAAVAWVRALNEVNNIGDWRETPLYVVGEATARPLQKMASDHSSKFTASLILGAEESGQAESLAKFVLLDLLSRCSQNGRLLYLAGDKNRDTFFKIMAENNIGVETLAVYETTAASDLGLRVSRVAQEIQLAGHLPSVWLIFFAPSSSGFVIPHLRGVFRLPTLEEPRTGEEDHPLAKIGAIGPTTSEYLRIEEGLCVRVVASEPTASSLVTSMHEFDTTMGDVND